MQLNHQGSITWIQPIIYNLADKSNKGQKTRSMEKLQVKSHENILGKFDNCVRNTDFEKKIFILYWSHKVIKSTAMLVWLKCPLSCQFNLYFINVSMKLQLGKKREGEKRQKVKKMEMRGQTNQIWNYQSAEV